MNIQETQHYLEINGEDRQIEITWDVIPCKTTSEFGDGIVTERWTEANPIVAVHILADGTEGEIYHFVDKEQSSLAKAIQKAMCEGKLTYD